MTPDKKKDSFNDQTFLEFCIIAVWICIYLEVIPISKVICDGKVLLKCLHMAIKGTW